MKRATEGTSASPSRSASVPGTGSGSTRRTCSARRLSGTRLVTSSRSPGQRASSSASVLRRSREELLEVVEQEQAVGPADVPDEELERGLAAARPQAHRVGDGGGHERGVAQGGELGDVHLALGARDPVGDLEREAGLAAAARPDERHEPHAREEPGQGLELPLPAHERGEAGTQHRCPLRSALGDHVSIPQSRPERPPVSRPGDAASRAMRTEIPGSSSTRVTPGSVTIAVRERLATPSCGPDGQARRDRARGAHRYRAVRAL